MAKKPAPADGSAAATSPGDASPVAAFEQSLDALETLVERMEQGEMSLEESLAAYERGIGLYRRCQAALEQAELRVRLLEDPARPDEARDFTADRDG
jgi:exodeoxyribonuclease VII small subunit